MNTKQNPTCSFIPPHMLGCASKAADPEVRDNARATAEETRELSRDRRQHALIESKTPGATAPAGKHRIVYDAKHRRSLPGTRVRGEGDVPAADVEINEAYDGSGSVYDFFKRRYGLDSIDGKGQPLLSTVHYGVKFDNAFWDGTQMIYGDGDGVLFNRFTAAIDVIGHELTHGVTQHLSSLGYSGQAGALNEHLSDAFGIMVKQEKLNQIAHESDWLIGAGLLAKGVNGKAIRSMAAPGTAYNDPRLGKDPQPAHMRDYVKTTADNGGVHINSGIPNKAFYLAAVTVGGYAWTAIGRIWYQTLKTRVHEKTDFAHFARGTVVVAGENYGIGSVIQQTVWKAWDEVGVIVPPDLTKPIKRRGGGGGFPIPPAMLPLYPEVWLSQSFDH